MPLTTLDLRGQAFDEYLRVSKDRSGRERSNHEQHDDNTGFLADYDITIGRTYSDVGSASQFARKPRGDFDKLVDDLERSRFHGRGLAMWEGSRGSRDDVEWSTLLRLLASHDKLVAITSINRFFDPADDYDYDALMRMALDARMDSVKTSKRVKRNAASNAAKGRPHGPAPYGYKHTYDPDTGDVSREIDDTEAPLMVEAFERVAAGHSLRAVARDLAGRGVVGRRGRPMTSETLRPMLLSDTYRGVRAHAPGSKGRHLRNGTVERYPGDWAGLVPEATFLAVHHRLTDPGRRTSRPGRGVHLLSMIAICDVCDGPITASFRRGPRVYGCQGHGHVRVPADDLDAEAEREIVDYLTDPDNADRLTAGAGDDEALAAARDAAARVRAELDDLYDQVGRGDVSATLAARAEPQLLARLRDADERVAELTTPPVLRGFAGSADDVAARWKAAPMPAKREVARMLLTPGLLGELRVMRSPTPGRPAPIADRIRWNTT